MTEQLMGELYRIETADGEVFWLTDGKTRYIVNTIDSAGLPPVDYQTRRPYKSDRLIETGFRLNPRSFSVSFQLTNKCSREEYWAARSALLDALRPNRGGELTLTLLNEESGVKRAIKARGLTPVFPAVPVDEINEWNLFEVLQFTANDPVFFEPDFTSHLLLNTPSDELSFPISFDDENIYFGAGAVFGTLQVPYTGTFYTYPIIIVTPPYDRVRVFHEELNAGVEVLRSSSTANLIIDLDTGQISDSDGNKLNNYLTQDSDKKGVKIEVDPIVAGGLNTLTFTIPGAVTPTTTVLVSFKTKYIGI